MILARTYRLRAILPHWIRARSNLYGLPQRRKIHPPRSAARLLSGSVTTRVVPLDRQSLLEQLNDVRVIEKALEEVVAKESAIVREMKDFRSKEAGLREDIGRIKDLLGTINGKVLDAQLERDRPTYETLVLDAPEAGKPILGR